MRYLVMGAATQEISGPIHHLQAGRTTEIEALNGAICRYGEAVGVLTPYNDAISRLVRFLEHKPSVEFHEAG